MRRATGVTCAWLLAVLVIPGAHAGAERFPMSDTGPLNRLLGVPDGWVRQDGPTAEISWTAANNATGQKVSPQADGEAGDEALLLDGETHTVTLRWQRQLGDRLSLGLQLPWLSHSGGFLDSAIDEFHDIFGMSEGIRPDRPENDLRYVYQRNGVVAFDLTHAESGIGDIRSSGALRVADFGGVATELTADIDWPTGDADKLTGSGGTDVALGLRLSQGGTERTLDWSVQAGLLWPGDADAPLPPAQSQIAWYDGALAWAATNHVDLLLQVQGHTAAWRSDLRMTGESALLLGAGALWRFNERYGVRFGFFEDLRTDTTADIAFELSLVRLADR